MSTQVAERGRIQDRIRRFFYGVEVPYGLALVRMTVPLSLLVALIYRWPVARELYSSDGAATPLWLMYGFPGMLPEPGGMVAVAGQALMMFLLVTSSIGWCTRFSLVAGTILFTYFNLLDTVSTITKYSVVATHAMLLLSMSNCGALWSVDAWLSRRRKPVWPGESAVASLRAPAWPRRLMQIMIGVVYFGAAITKMHTPTFFDGTQLLYWFVTPVNLSNPLGQYLSLYPSFIVISCYFTVVWEILFLFTAWRGTWRVVMLSLGAMFHIMTFFTLGLEVFPMVCMSIYFAFLEEQDIQGLARAARGLRRRMAAWGPLATLRTWSDAASGRLSTLPRYASPLALAVTIVLMGGSALAVEHWLDPYGQRRPEGPHTLTAMDPELVREMLTPSRSIRHEDKVFSFEVGSSLVGGALFNGQHHFERGDSLVAQIMFHPPHEDMVVECSLHDADNHALLRTPQAVPREMLRMTFFLPLEESLEPGTYSVVVSTSGTEIGRRTITVHPGDQAPVQAVLGN